MENEIRKYLDWKGTYASRASVNYKIWLRRFIEVCEDKPLGKYTIEDIIKFKHWLETRYGSASVQFAVIVLKNFFNFYKQQNFDCLSTAFIKIPPLIRKSHKAITEVEFQKILERIPTKEFLGLRDALIVRLLWDTGVRVSELCELNLSQISDIKNSAVIFSKKSQIQRVIVWSAETHLILLKYMNQRLKLNVKKDYSALLIGYLRGRGWTKRLTQRSVERMIRNYASKAGIIQKLSPHSFRHGWAHKRRDLNAPLAFIQKGLGHSSPVSTFIYEQYGDLEFETNAGKYFAQTSR